MIVMKFTSPVDRAITQFFYVEEQMADKIEKIQDNPRMPLLTFNGLFYDSDEQYDYYQRMLVVPGQKDYERIG